MTDATRTAPGAEPAAAAESAAGAAGAAADAKALDRSLVQGVAWTAGVKWLSQILSWGSTLVVARLLTPSDYGLLSMATVFLGLVMLLNEFGMGLAVVQQRRLTTHQIAQINGLSVLFGLGAALIGAAAAWPLARFYDAPALTAVVLVLSANFVITSFRTVPLALLQRDLQFRRVALNEGVQAIVLSLATVLFAALGFRYWTLVIGSVLSSLLSTGFAVLQRPHRLAWPRLGEIREAFTFGSHVVVSRLCWYGYQNADFLVAGKLLGKEALGAYSFGWTIAGIPVQKVSAMVGRVTPSIFSAVQDDNAALRRYVNIITEGLALVTVPAAVGMGLVAEEFVLLALGEQWRGAIAPLRLLAVYAAFRSIVTILPQVAQATGLSREGMRNAVLSVIVMPIAFLVGARWGTTGIAGAWIVGYPLVTLPLYVIVFRRIEMPVGRYLASLWPAASGALLMTAGVQGLRLVLPAEWPLAVRLTALALTGAAVYAATMLVLHRSRTRELLATLKSLRGGKGRRPAGRPA